MIEKHEVEKGAVIKTAPIWLTILTVILLATVIPNEYVAGALVFIVVTLLTATAYMLGWAEGVSKALPLVQDAGALAERASAEVERLSGPLTLTGGGPLDGDTMPNPSDRPRLLVYDPESEELEGCYVSDPERPGVLTWEPVEEEDDDALQE